MARYKAIKEAGTWDIDGITKDFKEESEK